jgi:hypothetical protein
MARINSRGKINSSSAKVKLALAAEARKQSKAQQLTRLQSRHALVKEEHELLKSGILVRHSQFLLRVNCLPRHRPSRRVQASTSKIELAATRISWRKASPDCGRGNHLQRDRTNIDTMQCCAGKSLPWRWNSKYEGRHFYDGLRLPCLNGWSAWTGAVSFLAADAQAPEFSAEDGRQTRNSKWNYDRVNWESPPKRVPTAGKTLPWFEPDAITHEGLSMVAAGFF